MLLYYFHKKNEKESKKGLAIKKLELMNEQSMMNIENPNRIS